MLLLLLLLLFIKDLVIYNHRNNDVEVRENSLERADNTCDLPERLSWHMTASSQCRHRCNPLGSPSETPSGGVLRHGDAITSIDIKEIERAEASQMMASTGLGTAAVTAPKTMWVELQFVVSNRSQAARTCVPLMTSDTGFRIGMPNSVQPLRETSVQDVFAGSSVS